MRWKSATCDNEILAVGPVKTNGRQPHLGVINHRLFLDPRSPKCQHAAMKQRYHTIIRPESNGWFVGWVEEIPGTLTQGRTLQECRRNLRDALQLMVETHRDEARLGMDENCILEAMEIEVSDSPQQYAQSYA